MVRAGSSRKSTKRRWMSSWYNETYRAYNKFLWLHWIEADGNKQHQKESVFLFGKSNPSTPSSLPETINAPHQSSNVHIFDHLRHAEWWKIEKKWLVPSWWIDNDERLHDIDRSCCAAITITAMSISIWQGANDHGSISNRYTLILTLVEAILIHKLGSIEIICWWFVRIGITQSCAGCLPSTVSWWSHVH